MNKKEFLTEYLEEYNKNLWKLEVELRLANRQLITDSTRKIVTAVGKITLPQQIVELKKDIKFCKDKIQVIKDELLKS